MDGGGDKSTAHHRVTKQHRHKSMLTAIQGLSIRPGSVHAALFASASAMFAQRRPTNVQVTLPTARLSLKTNMDEVGMDTERDGRQLFLLPRACCVSVRPASCQPEEFTPFERPSGTAV